MGSFPAGASPYGMLDAAGNVSEWTSNKGPGGREEKPIHGGEYSGSWVWMACTKRNGDSDGRGRGFRCASGLPQQ
ncbi:MAG TPA: hypothetical protein VIF09_20760 [Polyangiaceae bacterium]